MFKLLQIVLKIYALPIICHIVENVVDALYSIAGMYLDQFLKSYFIIYRLFKPPHVYRQVPNPLCFRQAKLKFGPATLVKVVCLKKMHTNQFTKGLQK